jgi:hypothetical protein
MRTVTTPGERDERPASEDYPALGCAVEAAARRHERIADPLARARAHARLLAALGEQVAWVAGDRDAALIEVLADAAHPSHRALSGELGLSRRRVDQLARIARAGGRPRRR